MRKGQGKTQVLPTNKINYAPVGDSSVGLKVCFYIHKHCQTMKVNVLFQNGPWLMRMKWRTSRPIFPQKARNRRAMNSFCFPAILLVSLIALLNLWWFWASHIFEDYLLQSFLSSTGAVIMVELFLLTQFFTSRFRSHQLLDPNHWGFPFSVNSSFSVLRISRNSGVWSLPPFPCKNII